MLESKDAFNKDYLLYIGILVSLCVRTCVCV